MSDNKNIGRGNRLFNDQCLRCGDPLIVDANGSFGEFHCCSSCTDFLHRAIYKVNKRGLKYPKTLYRHKYDLKHVVDVYKEPE